MDKIRALNVAIDLAKAAIENPSSNAAVYPNEKSANDVADFIEKLTERLISQ